ncbi:MAG: T9SS type A sorting domain-containing protein [Flavobacteriales bacterium]
MKRLTFLIVICLNLLHLKAQDKLLSLEGAYQEKNLVVYNPPQADGFGFCVTKVLVNGEILPAAIQSAHFEINFNLFQLKKADHVFVVLEHAPGCQPRFLNPEVLLPKSTFQCTAITADKSGLIHWTTTEESGSLDFIVEQFRWNRWVEVGQVKGKGTKQANSYQFQITPHSGKNQVRVSQVDNSGSKRSSGITYFQSGLSSPKISPTKVRDNLYFKAGGNEVKSKYEVYDAYGNLLKVGFASMVDCRNLVSGVYFINFDNQTEKFIKIAE